MCDCAIMKWVGGLLRVLYVFDLFLRLCCVDVVKSFIDYFELYLLARLVSLITK